MKKGSTLFTMIIGAVLAYIPSVILYMKSSSLMDIPTMFYLPQYLVLIVTLFFVLGLIAYAFKFYTLAIVVAYIPLIAEVVVLLISLIASFFFKDFFNAFIQDKIMDLVGAPIKAAAGVAEMPGKALGATIKGIFGQ